jgi:hypothetical protein
MAKALGIALFGGVSAWAAHLLLSYLLADLGCRSDSWTLLVGRHALTLVAAALVVAVTLSVRPLLVRQSSAGRAAIMERPFLAWIAVILNSLFLFAILLAGATSIFLAPCA